MSPVCRHWPRRQYRPPLLDELPLEEPPDELVLVLFTQDPSGETTHHSPPDRFFPWPLAWPAEESPA